MVPVLPFATVSAVASVSAPVLENDDVAVAPKYAGPNDENAVVDAPPFKRMMEVVALKPAAGCVQASYAVRPLLASVPQERTPFVDFTSQAAAPNPETLRFVVEATPVFEMEKSVEVAVPPVVEAISNKVSGAPVPEVEVAVMARSAYGVEVPMPTLLLKIIDEVVALNPAAG